jgi:hypothetical protein
MGSNDDNLNLSTEERMRSWRRPRRASTKLASYRTGPWARIELTADEILRSFPTAHTDFLTQYVDYPINSEKVASGCDSEAANTVTLKLAVDGIQGRRTVDDAGHFSAAALVAYAMARDAPYAERLQFNTPSAKTADQDEGIVGSTMLDQLGEKIKDAFAAGYPPR